jgi:hypothetical protein
MTFVTSSLGLMRRVLTTTGTGVDRGYDVRKTFCGNEVHAEEDRAGWLLARSWFRRCQEFMTGCDSGQSTLARLASNIR